MLFKLPKKNEKINKWEVSELLYENQEGKKHYDHHSFWTYNEAVKFYEKNTGQSVEQL